MNTLFALVVQLSGVGTLMGPTLPPGDSPPPPTPTFAILTEAGDRLTTEAVDILVTEAAP